MATGALIYNISRLPNSEQAAIVFLQQSGILPATKLCSENHAMKVHTYGSRLRWQCVNRSHCQRQDVRRGTCLQSTHISLVNVTKFLYYWAVQTTSIKWCQRELQMNKNTTVSWNAFLREVCVFAVSQQNAGRIGGPGLIVEVDESLFTKRKNHAGRMLPQQWIFGGICRQTGETFLLPVPNRSATTLLEAMVAHIREGTTIYSDCWKGYITNDIEAAGFEHYRVNHKYNFVDPETGAHTQTVERLWGSVKWRNRRHRGTARHHLKSYLAEFMWRSRIPATQDPFEAILAVIAAYWPPD